QPVHRAAGSEERDELVEGRRGLRRSSHRRASPRRREDRAGAVGSALVAPAGRAMRSALFLLLACATLAQGSLKDAAWRVADVARGGGENLQLDVHAGENESSCTVIDNAGGERAV